MAFNMKTWANPISLDATNLNRIEQGVQNNADILDILQDEVANLQNNQLDITQELATLLNDTPNIVATLTNITNILNNNDLSALLTNTDSFLSKSAQTLSNAEIAQVYKNLGIDKFLKLTSITVDGQSVVSGSKVEISLPTIDQTLNIFSNKAISNAAVTKAINTLKSSISDIDIYIPTNLSEFAEDDDHMLVTKTDKSLWNSYKNMFTTPDNITSLLADYALIDHDHDTTYSQIYHTHAEIIQAIPVVPTDISAFNNDVPYATEEYVKTNGGKIDSISVNGAAQTITNKNVDIPIPTKVSALINDAGYLTSFTETDPTVPAWAKTAVKPSYTYSEILNTPTIPTNNNQLTNGAGYITESEAGTVVDTKLTTFETNKITPINNSINSLQTKDAQLTSAIATLETSYKSYTDTAIANLVDSAPDTLNTLKELADAITINDSMLDALTEAVSNHNHDDIYSKLGHNHDATYSKLSHNHDSTYVKQTAFDTTISGLANTYATLTDKATLQTNIDTVQSNVDTVQTNLNNLDNNVVHISNNETITGTKTFTTAIYVPDITIS